MRASVFLFQHFLELHLDSGMWTWSRFCSLVLSNHGLMFFQFVKAADLTVVPAVFPPTHSHKGGNIL